ncbi:Alpha/beta hydrolase fold-1 [Penicillium hispanicum]|uniref:Alpha/beta hydrolase fold-1 n=1 Tax=Penicillium hispanicum TaxID=1080232 RepID=UPI00253FCA24|nr:Alpha/beta hydrolase fold-1 [Penicillium hispanicum]KAJ5573479.1 Alpha/beta hydrolase fold-1 [Penicillium hispanicum]
MERGSQNPISHSSWNDGGSDSIVLIHGAFAAGTWWDLVVPYLPTKYHILTPDLPGHGQASEQEFSVPSAVDSVAQLIRDRAIYSHAHVVGHSLGAQVAIQLACTHPDIVRSVFISGFGSLPRTLLTPCVPYAVWAMQRVENLVPRAAVRWAMDGTDLPRTNTRLNTLALCQQIMAPSDAVPWPSPWPARTLIVVAGKGGLIPSADNTQVALRLMQTGRERNAATVAYAHPEMRHPWNRQDPRLFADAVIAWIEEKDLPDGFVKLE